MKLINYFITIVAGGAVFAILFIAFMLFRPAFDLLGSIAIIVCLGWLGYEAIRG